MNAHFIGILAIITMTFAATDTHSSVIDLWGGASESIALKADGSVWTWGWDDYGILGNGYGVSMFDTSTRYDSLVPVQVHGPGGFGYLNSINAIAGGERHNTALDSNGDVWAWGWNYFGQLGIGTYCTDMNSPDCMATTPLKIPDLTSVKTIASRGYHTLALKNDGTVWAWGYNDSGRLGDGTTADRHSPVQVGGLSGHGKVMVISSGGAVSAALMEDHTLMAWGLNSYGAVGNGETNDTGQWTPTLVSQSTGLTSIKAIATGWDHMVALSEDGTVWTWGAGAQGQLGNGTKENSNVPVQVSGLSDIVGVSAGDGATVVLKTDGTVWAWGTLRTEADGNTAASYYYGATPVQVTGIDQVSLVRARDYHVLALKTDGTVWAWGWNLKGQCGDGTVNGNKITPVKVAFASEPPQYYKLSVSLPESGAGNVSSSPAGIACVSGSTAGCSADYTIYSQIKLTSVHGSGSIFTGWGGACSGTDTCTVSMDSNKSVTADFSATTNVSVKVGDRNYSTLQAAYTDDATRDNAMIKLLEGGLAGEFVANRNIMVTLQGGYNALFDTVNSDTVIQSPVLISAGTVNIRDIKVH